VTVFTGSLVAIQRPAFYVERRSDGYREPEVVLILGTAHLSEQSAQDARRLIETVQPANVVVELCRSRAGIMYETEATSGSTQRGEFQAGYELEKRIVYIGLTCVLSDSCLRQHVEQRLTLPLHGHVCVMPRNFHLAGVAAFWR